MRYGTSSPFDNFRNLVQRGGTPVTNTLLIANVLTFFALFLSPEGLGAAVMNWMVFIPGEFLQKPWTLLTYTLVTEGPIALLWGGIILWFTGGSLERSWGSERYAKLFFSLAVVSALFFYLGCIVLKIPQPLIGFYLPMAGIIVAFCALNPEQLFNFFFVSIPAKYIIIITFVFVWYSFGRDLGLFVCGGPLAAYLYVQYGRSWSRPGSFSQSRGRSDHKIIDLNSRRLSPGKPSYIDGSLRRSPFDIAGKLKDYQDRKRLERLLKSSGIKDPDRDDDNHRFR